MKTYNLTDKFCIDFSHNFIVKTLIIIKIVKFVCVQHMTPLEKLCVTCIYLL